MHSSFSPRAILICGVWKPPRLFDEPDFLQTHCNRASRIDLHQRFTHMDDGFKDLLFKRRCPPQSSFQLAFLQPLFVINHIVKQPHKQAHYQRGSRECERNARNDVDDIRCISVNWKFLPHTRNQPYRRANEYCCNYSRTAQKIEYRLCYFRCSFNHKPSSNPHPPEFIQTCGIRAPVVELRGARVRVKPCTWRILNTSYAGGASLYHRRASVRTSPLPDFYVGAHATIGRLAILTRDEVRYRTYFPKVEILAPR